MIYLDNSSTTHRKPISVLLSVLKAMTIDSVNLGRGGYPLTLRAESRVMDARDLFRDSFNIDSSFDVIFTHGCTDAINMALLGSVKNGGHIVATIYEHNSVLRTLEYMQNTYDIRYTLVKPRADGIVHPKDIEDSIESSTYLIVTNHTSNVVGCTIDINAIGRIAKAHKIMYMVDGAQSVGHVSVDMKKCNINMLTIAGHKGLYAPQGVGVLLLNNIKIKPTVFGGTGTYSDSLVQPSATPEGLESGTHNLAGIYGIYAGLKFVNKNFDKINKKIAYLTEYLIEGLKDVKGVKVYTLDKKSGVVSFNIGNVSSNEISDILATTYKIATRSGLHCAPMVHKHHSTLTQGMVRASISYFNSKKDISRLLKAVKKISQNYSKELY